MLSYCTKTVVLDLFLQSVKLPSIVYQNSPKWVQILVFCLTEVQLALFTTFKTSKTADVDFFYVFLFLMFTYPIKPALLALISTYVIMYCIFVSYYYISLLRFNMLCITFCIYALIHFVICIIREIYPN